MENRISPRKMPNIKKQRKQKPFKKKYYIHIKTLSETKNAKYLK